MALFHHALTVGGTIVLKDMPTTQHSRFVTHTSPHKRVSKRPWHQKPWNWNQVRENATDSELTVKCLSWNVWSLNNKSDQVLEFATDHDVSLIFIQETWFTDGNNQTTATIKSCGFKIFHVNRQEQVRGGVAIIYKPNVSLISNISDILIHLCESFIAWQEKSSSKQRFF